LKDVERTMQFFIVLAMMLGSMAQSTGNQLSIKPEISDARAFTDWDLDGNGTWKVRGNVLALEGEGKPGGPIRRPGALAILKSEPLTDLTLRLELRSTAPVDLPVRDVLLIFGYQSPTQFYYVHLSARTDAVHNGIFVVNNADRRRLDEPATRAPLTDQAWHRARLERDVTTGRIAVFFGNDTDPVLSTVDKTLTWGRVGVGSFDETGEFRNVEVTGRRK